MRINGWATKCQLFALVLFTFIIIFSTTKIHNFGSENPDIPADNLLVDELFEIKQDDLDVKIRYPQIESSEHGVTEQINSLIKESAINEYYNHWVLKGLTLEQTYNIEKQETDLLSIVFYGDAYVAGTAHPTATCHAVTINLETAEKYDLSDLLESYEYLEKRIIDNNYEVLSGGFKALNSVGILSEVRSEFRNIPIEQNTQNFYIAEDGAVCIIIELPHAGGDYSVLKIDVSV